MHYVVIGSRGCIRKRSLIETENKGPQVLLQDDCIIDSIAHGLSMIAHSRKAVDEDGRLCLFFVFLVYFIITNKNLLFHTLPFCEKQHSAALAHLLHPRSPAKPSSLHWSSSYQPFARAVRTRGLTRVIQRSF